MAGLDLEAIKAERARLQAAYLTPDRPATSARGIHHAALIGNRDYQARPTSSLT